jgi:hypothetical protein
LLEPFPPVGDSYVSDADRTGLDVGAGDPPLGSAVALRRSSVPVPPSEPQGSHGPVGVVAAEIATTAMIASVAAMVARTLRIVLPPFGRGPT